VSLKRDCGHITTKTLPGLLKKLKGLNELVSDEDIVSCLLESYAGRDQEVDFDFFVRVLASWRFPELLNCNFDSNGG
jgi:plastin-1